MRVTVIGIPESTRVAGFRDALLAAGHEPPEVVSWVDVLEGATPEGLVRIDSPGRSWNTEKRLLGLGVAAEGSGDGFTALEIRSMSEPAGRIVARRQWHRGWSRALGELKARARHASFSSDPDDLILLFDKHACQERLERFGCRAPRSLGTPAGFDDLRERMRLAGCRRVMLKSCHGSSASGMLALEMSRGRIQAFTTARLANGALWNHRPVRLTTDWAEIIALVDALCRHKAQAQWWVPKMGWLGHRIDLRVVTIGGRAAHTIVRMSRTPFTNLQLFNQRGNMDRFGQEHPDALAAARAEAERAAAAFPRCLALGIDVALDPAGRAWVLEANAFGDLLPGCLVDGWDTYRWQVEAMRARYVSATGL